VILSTQCIFPDASTLCLCFKSLFILIPITNPILFGRKKQWSGILDHDFWER
jgi:hypothetical protein